MSLNLQMLINNDLLDELAGSFTDESSAKILLTSIGYPWALLPNFDNFKYPRDFWFEICGKIENGAVNADFEDLLKAAAKSLPGNKTFAPFAQRPAPATVAPNLTATASSVYPVKALGQYEAFVSYSRKDQDEIRCIAKKIKNRNVSVWLDEWSIPAGVQFAPEIEKVLAVVPAVVVFCGLNGLGPWQQTEVYAVYDRAFRKRCKLIPVLLDGVTASSLPPFLQTFNAISIKDCNDDAGIDQLIKAIKGKP